MTRRYVLCGVITAAIFGIAIIAADQACAKPKSRWTWHDNHRMEVGSGVLSTETKELPVFTAIESHVGMDIVVRIGSPQSVQVTIDDNLQNNFECEVHRGILEIDSRGSFTTDEEGRIEIVVARLDEVELHGSGNVLVENLDAERFAFHLSGSGNVDLRGKTNILELSLDGSGDIDTRKLMARDAVVEVNGSGDVKVHATGTLDGAVNGSGDILVYGNPKRFLEDVSGSGSIRRRD